MTRLRIRDAKVADAEALRPLLAQLGYSAAPAEVAHRLGALLGSGRDAVLVAEEDGRRLGLLALHWGEMLHLAGPVARIGTLVVAEGAQSRGIGALLVREAEALAQRQGCTLIEVTTGRARERTHAFYAAQGYVCSSLRLHKPLEGTG